MNIISCYFERYRETEIKKVSQDELDFLESVIEPIFVFALIWSLCCTCDYEGRIKFDKFIREQLNLKLKNKDYMYPQEGLIYDYFFKHDPTEQIRRYELWQEQFKDFVIDSKLAYHEIMIPTNDSQRNIYLT